MQDIIINTPFIKLEQFLKFAGVVQTGGHAKLLIKDNRVLLNGQICPLRGKKLYGGDIVGLLDFKEEFRCVFNED